jgi:hypothetical protein
MVLDAMLFNTMRDNKTWELIPALVSVPICMVTAFGFVLEELFGEPSR